MVGQIPFTIYFCGFIFLCYACIWFWIILCWSLYHWFLLYWWCHGRLLICCKFSIYLNKVGTDKSCYIFIVIYKCYLIPYFFVCSCYFSYNSKYSSFIYRCYFIARCVRFCTYVYGRACNSCSYRIESCNLCSRCAARTCIYARYVSIHLYQIRANVTFCICIYMDFIPNFSITASYLSYDRNGITLFYTCNRFTAGTSL